MLLVGALAQQQLAYAAVHQFRGIWDLQVQGSHLFVCSVSVRLDHCRKHAGAGLTISNQPLQVNSTGVDRGLVFAFCCVSCVALHIMHAPVSETAEVSYGGRRIPFNCSSLDA